MTAKVICKFRKGSIIIPKVNWVIDIKDFFQTPSMFHYLIEIRTMVYSVKILREKVSFLGLKNK